jgi:nucleotide-binding universal stress UspA family protein
MGMIIVGVDGSETAAAAARVAADLATAMSAPLHVVTAYERGSGMRGGDAAHPGTTSTLDTAEGLLAVVAADLRLRHTEVTTAALAGKPADVVCEEAERKNASLIVVGNKRMRGPSKVLGAVASRVASRAPCDVYIAHTV